MKLNDRQIRNLTKLLNVILDGRSNDGELLNAARLVSQLCRAAQIYNFEELIQTLAPHRIDSLFADLIRASKKPKTKKPTAPVRGSDDAWQEDVPDERMPGWTAYGGSKVLDIARLHPLYLRSVGQQAASDITNPAALRFARMADQALKSMGLPGL